MSKVFDKQIELNKGKIFKRKYIVRTFQRSMIKKEIEDSIGDKLAGKNSMV